jgi:hypothetical protein
VAHHHVIGFLDFLFVYMSCSQIWLNPLVADHHFWSNMRKLKKNPVDYTLKTKYRNGGNFYLFSHFWQLKPFKISLYFDWFLFYFFGEISPVRKRLIWSETRVSRPVTKHVVCQSATNLTGCLLCFWCLMIKCRGVEGVSQNWGSYAPLKICL